MFTPDRITVRNNIRKGKRTYVKRKDRSAGSVSSIAAYKTAYLASALKKLNADVHVPDDTKRDEFH